MSAYPQIAQMDADCLGRRLGRSLSFLWSQFLFPIICANLRNLRITP